MTTLIDFFGLKDAQREAAEARGVDVAVMAGAGSGKTRTLAARFISLLAEGHTPRSLAAITFTEKAAREMRNRIRADIAAWRAGPCPPEQQAWWADVEAEIDAARIGTIHGLCAAILRAHPAEAGIDPRFEVLDEGQTIQLRSEAADEAAQWASDTETFGPLFVAFGADELRDALVRLIDARLDAEAALGRAETVGAWSTIVLELVNEFATRDDVKGAVADLRALQASHGLVADAGDKLAAQVEVLLAQWSRAEIACEAGLVGDALAALYTMRREGCAGNVGKKTGRAKDLVAAVRAAYDDRIDPWLGGSRKSDPEPDLAAEAQIAALVPLLATAFQHASDLYREAKDLRQALDFDDLEQIAVRLLRLDSVRSRWQSQIDSLLVDEFQDTNARQREIVEALAGWHDGKRGRLFIVGDAKQSIYRFRGADVTVFRDLGAEIVRRGGLSVSLDTTYRAHAQLVSGINDLAAAVLDDVPPGDARIPFAALQAARAAAPRLIAPHVRFVAAQGEDSVEGRAVAAAALAQELHALRAQGFRWDEIALLFRASTAFPVYEAALENAGIPFVTVAGRGFFDRPEIRDLLTVLAAVADPWDDLALAGALRSPMFGLRDSTLYALRWPVAGGKPAPLWPGLRQQGVLAALPHDEQVGVRRATEILGRLHLAADRVPVAELLKQLLDETRYLGILAITPGGSRLRRNVEKLLTDAHVNRAGRLTDFLDTVQTLRDVGAREGEAPSDAGGAVRLLTVHKAKGLEFPVVVLADAGYQPRHVGETVSLTTRFGMALAPRRLDVKPILYRLAQAAEAAHERAEDARLLYVAATRAQEVLLVSGHLTRQTGTSWLNALAHAAGLQLESLAQEPGVVKQVRLAGGESASAVVYVAGGETHASSEVASPSASTAFDADAMVPLYGPVRESATAREPDQKRQERHELRAHRITRRLLRTDGAWVGQLVHEALRRWRFPGDAGYDLLMSAAARAAGLIDLEQAEPHLQRAAELLTRFRQDPAWIDLNAAQRDGRLRHEIPYLHPSGGAGVMDLLYQDVAGEWQIVDFKTDAVADPDEAEKLIRDDYGEQLQRYLRAAAALLGRRATARLCWFDLGGQVHWQDVAEEQPQEPPMS